MEYDFDKPRKVESVEVYWWDDAKHGHCRVQESWSLQYKAADGSWKSVPGNPAFGTSPDTFNRTSFEPVQTTALRIQAQLKPDYSAGILQWKVKAAN